MTKANGRVVAKKPLNQRTPVRLNRELFARLALHTCHRPGHLADFADNLEQVLTGTCSLYYIK